MDPAGHTTGGGGGGDGSPALAPRVPGVLLVPLGELTPREGPRTPGHTPDLNPMGEGGTADAPFDTVHVNAAAQSALFCPWVRRKK